VRGAQRGEGQARRGWAVGRKSVKSQQVAHPARSGEPEADPRRCRCSAGAVAGGAATAGNARSSSARFSAPESAAAAEAEEVPAPLAARCSAANASCVTPGGGALPPGPGGSSGRLSCCRGDAAAGLPAGTAARRAAEVGRSSLPGEATGVSRAIDESSTARLTRSSRDAVGAAGALVNPGDSDGAESIDRVASGEPDAMPPSLSCTCGGERVHTGGPRRLAWAMQRGRRVRGSGRAPAREAGPGAHGRSAGSTPPAAT
jgi:hypothetical protein